MKRILIGLLLLVFLGGVLAAVGLPRATATPPGPPPAPGLERGTAEYTGPGGPLQR